MKQRRGHLVRLPGQFAGQFAGRFAVGALCAALALPAFAQNDVVRAPNDNPLRSLSRGLQMTTEPKEAPDWVVKTRQPDRDYKFIPTGAAARTEPAPALKPDRLKEIERDLDAARARHDRLSGRAAAPAAKRSVAMEPIVKKKGGRRDCALTCASPLGTPRKR